MAYADKQALALFSQCLQVESGNVRNRTRFSHAKTSVPPIH